MIVGYTNQPSDADLRRLRNAGCATIYTELTEAVNDLRPEDTLLVLSLSTIARNTRELLAIGAVIQRKRAVIYSLNDREAWVTDAGAALAGLAAFEARSLGREQKNGRDMARGRGVPFGRPPKLSPAQRQEALELYASGLPQAEVARLFGVSPSVICQLVAKDHAAALAERCGI